MTIKCFGCTAIHIESAIFILNIYIIKWPVSVCVYICIHSGYRKYSDPYIFHSLLYCSHLLKSFKFIFFPH